MKTFLSLLFIFIAMTAFSQKNLRLSDNGYFTMPGLDVTVFADIYPEGHQTGVTIIQHGERVAANGDVRLEVSPGQWSPIPKAGELIVDKENNSITQKLSYPDSARDNKGFNPIIYPDLQLHYQVKVTPLKNSSFKISVDLNEPLPAEWVGKAGFNLEFFPGSLFGKTFQFDGRSGIFPLQAIGPMVEVYNGHLTSPLGSGNNLTIASESELQRMNIQSTGTLELWDGRSNYNNGWFIVREAIPVNKKEKAIEWTVTPNVTEKWKYEPVIHISQIGYHPNQSKTVIIETDSRDENIDLVSVYKIAPEGKKEVKSIRADLWGKFLRYNYFKADISDIKESGMYIVTCGNSTSNPFMIDTGVYEKNVWQPVVDYFLPAQMCHMRVEENYRVWHDACHLDDALMAPVNLNHFDGYQQGSTTLNNFKSGEHVPGLNRGGWHDAGDDDLRIESQIGEVIILSMIIEEFNLNYDATTIDNEKLVTEIHKPDGRNDIIQQIEHGLESILGGYRSMGRLYRGIICPTLEQYVILGDPATVTDNKVDEILSGESASDDRWVFTEENARHECMTGAGLAIASRVLKTENPSLSEECLKTAKEIWEIWGKSSPESDSRAQFLAELFITTKDKEYESKFCNMESYIIKRIERTGWIAARVLPYLSDKSFIEKVTQAVSNSSKEITERSSENPFGVPYKPIIWGAGWTIQYFGVGQYFLNKAWPEIISADNFINSLNFVLGVHPGKNTASFASGVGSNSVTTAYGFNRADWSYIPGGVVSGTALIRPDLPELKEWPYFWQQTEYVMGGGSTNFMFLVLAVDNYLKKNN